MVSRKSIPHPPRKRQNSTSAQGNAIRTLVGGKRRHHCPGAPP